MFTASISALNLQRRRRKEELHENKKKTKKNLFKKKRKKVDLAPAIIITVSVEKNEIKKKEDRKMYIEDVEESVKL